LQEQEQEQEQEKEEEQEQEMEVEECVKQKYSRDDEKVHPWPLEALCEPPSADAQGFYPFSDFGVYTKVLGRADVLKVPGFLHLSANHYKKHWSLKSHRRLKNIIVTLEYTHDASDVKPAEFTGQAITPEQEAMLKTIYDVFCIEGQTTLQLKELKQFLTALDVNISKDAEQIEVIMAKHPDGMPFEALRDMVHQQAFYNLQAGRHYVALTLEEAETVRSALHIRQGRSLLEDSEQVAAIAAATQDAADAADAAAAAPEDEGLATAAAAAATALTEAKAAATPLSTAARLKIGYLTLDASDCFKAGSDYQETIAAACLNFIGSEYNFRENELNMLIRSLHDNTRDQRKKYFEAVRSCRRRTQIPTRRTPLLRLFTTADGYQLLDTRALIIRIKHLIIERGMLVFDAFRAFNHSRSGALTCSEFYGGITWCAPVRITTQHSHPANSLAPCGRLGLELTEAQVHSIVRAMDQDADGFVTFEEFKEAFYDPILE
jgi:Ca2+-binding EF-hand superfamily protein